MDHFLEATAIFQFQDLTSEEEKYESIRISHLTNDASDKDIEIFGQGLALLVDPERYHYVGAIRNVSIQVTV